MGPGSPDLPDTASEGPLEMSPGGEAGGRSGLKNRGLRALRVRVPPRAPYISQLHRGPVEPSSHGWEGRDHSAPRRAEPQSAHGDETRTVSNVLHPDRHDLTEPQHAWILGQNPPGGRKRPRRALPCVPETFVPPPSLRTSTTTFTHASVAETGLRARLRPVCPSGLAGSIPVARTISGPGGMIRPVPTINLQPSAYRNAEEVHHV